MHGSNLSSRRLTGLAIVVGLFLGPAALEGSARAEPVIHVVERGDTLIGLAQRYDVTTDELRRWNSLDGEVVRLGHPLVVGEQPEPELEPSSTETRLYVVEEADTLGCIAVRFGVTIEQLQAWNEGLDPDHIEVGQRITILGGDDAAGEIEGSDRPALRRRRVHVVRPGDTVWQIAERYRMTVEEIRELNPGLDPDQIAVDQRLTVLTTERPTESVGLPTCGRLLHGRRLPPHPAYVLRDPERAWATEETIEHLLGAFDEVRRQHPDAPRVRVHDLSLPGGGPIDDHRSHQSGRDVDITYYQRRCSDEGCPLGPVRPRRLALGPQWTLIAHLIRSGAVQIMFIDYGLQEVLYNYARRHGATPQELNDWFQYPRGRRSPMGIIRHFPNHYDHVHVRFACPEGDELCR